MDLKLKVRYHMATLAGLVIAIIWFEFIIIALFAGLVAKAFVTSHCYIKNGETTAFIEITLCNEGVIGFSII